VEAIELLWAQQFVRRQRERRGGHI